MFFFYVNLMGYVCVLLEVEIYDIMNKRNFIVIVFV